MPRQIRVLVAAGAISAASLLAGCATQPPSGPTVVALPAAAKSLESFQGDDRLCRTYASGEVASRSGGRPGSNPAATGALLGTVGGAALGAALGAVGGNAGAGTAVGATTGLLGGALIGSGQAATDEYSLQQIYDIAHTQCMYAHGNTVTSPPTSYALGLPYQYAGLYPYPYPPPALIGPPFFGGGIFVFGHRGFHHFDHFHHFHHFDNFHRFDHFQHFDGSRHR